MELVEQLRQSTVQIANGGGHGAGIAWDANGTVVTNAHVLRGKALRVIDAEGRTAPARVVRRDEDRDLGARNQPAAASGFLRRFRRRQAWSDRPGPRQSAG